MPWAAGTEIGLAWPWNSALEIASLLMAWWAASRTFSSAKAPLRVICRSVMSAVGSMREVRPGTVPSRTASRIGTSIDRSTRFASTAATRAVGSRTISSVTRPIGGLAAPVAVEGFERDARALLVLDEPVRPGADGLPLELVEPDPLDVGLRHHVGAQEVEPGDGRRHRLGEVHHGLRRRRRPRCPGRAATGRRCRACARLPAPGRADARRRCSGSRRPSSGCRRGRGRRRGSRARGRGPCRPRTSRR